MIKALIFDCYGVLVEDALAMILVELKKTDPELANKIIVLVDKVVDGTMEPAEYQQQAATLLGMTSEEYVNKLREGQIKNVALLEYIEELKTNYKIGLLSNVAKHGLYRHFTGEELHRYFDVVVESGDIGFAKPNAQAYEITADRLGVRLDGCIMIDDQDSYCEGARRVGMNAVKYKSFTQFKRDAATFGYKK